MADLNIKDIETLERLSPDEMNQVVGGMDCPGGGSDATEESNGIRGRI